MLKKLIKAIKKVFNRKKNPRYGSNQDPFIYK